MACYWFITTFCSASIYHESCCAATLRLCSDITRLDPVKWTVWASHLAKTDGTFSVLKLSILLFFLHGLNIKFANTEYALHTGRRTHALWLFPRSDSLKNNEVTDINLALFPYPFLKIWFHIVKLTKTLLLCVRCTTSFDPGQDVCKNCV